MAKYPRSHTTAKAKLAPIVEANGHECMEIVCLMDDRWIPAGTTSDQWDLAHDRDNPGHYLGPAHPRCNRAEGGRQAQILDGAPVRAWLL
jgi:hypothetical protein